MLTAVRLPPHYSLQIVYGGVHSALERCSSASAPFHFRVRFYPKRRNHHLPLVVRASYTRIPLDTAGAYRLVDNVTGESFIVWGTADDQQHADSTIPSENLLSWDPTFDPSLGSKGRKPSGGITVGSFGKLNAQRVRALITKKEKKRIPSLLKTRPATLDGTEDDENGSEDEYIGPSNVGNSASQSEKSNFLRTVYPESDPEDKETPALQWKGHQAPSPPPSRGWGTGPMPSFRSGSVVSPKQHRKLSPAGGGFFSRKSFRELGCSDYMIEALRSLQFLRPSNIQAMSFVPVLEGKSCIIADQSGSGKTLAYLTPIIQCLRQQELLDLVKSLPSNPRAVILVPTAELATQVLNNCRSVSKSGVPFRSVVATGGFRQKTQLESLRQELDVLIATPGRFVYLLKEGFLKLSNLKSVVLDEVDILFRDEDFEEVLKSLISSAPMTTQYLFVTATLPVDIYNKLVGVFPDCEVIMGPGIHRTSTGLEEALVDCSGNVEEKSIESAFLNKKSALLRLAEESPVPRTIIFCNKIETCRKVENTLRRFDRTGLRIRVLPFHAAIEQDLRLSNMREFLGSKRDEFLFLVCTDRASRGIDFTNVDHVVLFDFPRDPSEYVRRVGRTARGAGGKGKAFIFAVGKQVSLARKIIERNLKGHPLHNVPSAYELLSSAL